MDSFSVASDCSSIPQPRHVSELKAFSVPQLNSHLKPAFAEGMKTWIQNSLYRISCGAATKRP